MMTQLFQAAPAMIPLLGDIFMANQDVPGAQQMAKRLKATLPPQIAQADQEGDDQPEVPPQVMAQMQQMQQQLQEGAQLVQALQQERERLEQELNNKNQEHEAKLAAVQGSIDEVKIKTLADLNIAEIQAESRERVAGLQAQVDHMQQMMDMFLAAIQPTGETGTQPTGE